MQGCSVNLILLLYLLWESHCGATTTTTPWAPDGNGIIQYSQEYLLSLQYRNSSTYQAGILSDPGRLDNQSRDLRGKTTRKRGRKGGLRQRLKRLTGKGVCPPLPSIMLANVRSLRNKLHELQANCKLQWAYREASLICITKAWLDNTIPD